MGRKCVHLNHNCPKCDRHFGVGHLVETCPDCGTDLHCNNYAAYGSKLCSSHGGPVPSRGWYGKGKAIVTGEHSNFPIAKLAAKYLSMTTDGRFLSNQQSLEIVRARIQQLAERIDLNEAPDRLAKLKELWDEFRELDGRGNHLEANIVKKRIDDEFEAAYHDYAAWQQMFEALDLDRKMVESEVKIAKDLKAIMTAKDAYEFGAKLMAAIIEAASALIVDDNVRSHFLKRIKYEFARLVGDRIDAEDPDRPGGSSGEIVDSVAGNVD